MNAKGSVMKIASQRDVTKANARTRLRLSVAMGTFRGARFLDEQLQSLRAQERPPDELVVCDDASGDRTAELVERFADGAGFPVRLVMNPTTLGFAKNFEKAIALCDGDIIALCDQDDVWFPHKLQRMEAVFLRSPSVSAAFSDGEVVDDGLRPLGYRLWRSLEFSGRQRRQAARRGLFSVLLWGNVVAGATLAFRQRLRSLILPIPSNFHHDEWIALCVAAVGRVAMCEEPLIAYRSHPGQAIGIPPRNGHRASLGSFVRLGLRPDPSSIQARAAYYAGQGYALIDRLADRGYEEHAALARRRLEERTYHLQGRAALWTDGGTPLSFVLQELVAGRYRRYSRGLLSAIKDAAKLARPMPSTRAP